VNVSLRVFPAIAFIINSFYNLLQVLKLKRPTFSPRRVNCANAHLQYVMIAVKLIIYAKGVLTVRNNLYIAIYYVVALKIQLQILNIEFMEGRN
jgi:hypothetical protein